MEIMHVFVYALRRFMTACNKSHTHTGTGTRSLLSVCVCVCVLELSINWLHKTTVKRLLPKVKSMPACCSNMLLQHSSRASMLSTRAREMKESSRNKG